MKATEYTIRALGTYVGDFWNIWVAFSKTFLVTLHERDGNKVFYDQARYLHMYRVFRMFKKL
jgi:hypothetical protein